MLGEFLIKLGQELIFSLFEITAALVVLTFGWYFSRYLGWFVQRLLESSKFYPILKQKGWDNFARRFNQKFTLPALVGAVAKWWLFLFFIMVCATIIGFGSANQFFSLIFNYTARGFAVLLVIMVAVISAEFVKNKIAPLIPRRARQRNFLAYVATAVIWVLASLGILLALDIISYKQLVGCAVVAVAFGAITILAAGFGAKELAAHIIKKALFKIRKKF